MMNDPFNDGNRLDDALVMVKAELIKATRQHGRFPTVMHALAVIEEEVDEFKYEVRHGDLKKAREEAIQVAAMAIRYLMDIA